MNRMIETVMTPYWTMTRGLNLAVRGIVVESADRVLLVRRPNVPEWELPGGHVAWHETPASALGRELRTIGVSMSEPPELENIMTGVAAYRSTHVCEFLVRNWTQSQALPEGRSATEYEFFPFGELPGAIDTTLAAHLQECLPAEPCT